MLVPIYAVSAGLLVGQVMSQAALSPCAAGCVSGVLADVSKTGCGVGDTACVCTHSDDVTNGIRDCVAKACAAEGAEQITLAEASGKERCAAAQAPAAPTSAPAAAPTTTPPAASSAEPAPPATTSQATTETSQPATAAASSTSSAVESASTTASTTALTTTSATTLETSASTTAQSSTSSSAASSTSTASSSATQSGGTAAQTGTADSTGSEEGGLSVAAKAGIGAGVGVALIMMGIIAICLTVRRKQQENEARRNNMIEISGPLPGGGRQYANEEGKYGSATTIGARKSYSSELEHHARPYEEMVPHTQPRTMI